MPAAAECKAGISAHPKKVFVQRTIQADAELGESLKEASAHEQSRSQLDKPCCQEHVASLTVKALQRALRLRRLRPQGDKEAALGLLLTAWALALPSSEALKTRLTEALRLGRRWEALSSVPDCILGVWVVGFLYFSAETATLTARSFGFCPDVEGGDLTPASWNEQKCCDS